MITAMADASATIQATLREMRNARSQVLSEEYRDTDPEDVDATIQASENFLTIIQVQLSYGLRRDGLLTMPGTNADGFGITTRCTSMVNY